MGIPEPRRSCPPVEPTDVDWALVPGITFDDRCRRLGRGAGYYDRLLPTLRRDVPLWALIFDAQWVAQLPVEPHDVPLDGVITPRKSRSVPGRRRAEAGHPSILGHRDPGGLGVGSEHVLDSGGRRVALVEDDAIAESNLLALWDSVEQLLLALPKWCEPKGCCCGEEAECLRPNVPRCGVTKALRVVQNSHANRLAVSRSDVIDPWRSLAPGGFIRQAFGVCDLAPGLFVDVHARWNAKSQQAFLRVVEEDVTDCSLQHDIEVQHPKVRSVVNRRVRSSSHAFRPVRSDPIVGCPENANACPLGDNLGHEPLAG